MLVSTHLAIVTQLEVSQVFQSVWLWLEATRCNPTQGPIKDNLRVKQFRQISGNYSQGLVAITSTRLTGREKDILTGLGK